MNKDGIFSVDQIIPADSEAEIINLTAEPYEDHRRVRVTFRLSFFQEPPNAAITLFGVEGEEITSVDVLNIFQTENEVTLHIPKARGHQGEYKVELTLFKLKERKARVDEDGEVKLSTQNLSTRTIAFTLQ